MWMATPDWYGETAFILGCGPSLRREDVEKLRFRRVIAINDSYLLAPWADILYFCDARWWRSNRFQINDLFRGHQIVTMDNAIPGVRTLRCTGESGLEVDPAALRHGCNSGYQAINLAYHLGVSKIALLGYDMRVHANGKTHWQHRPGPSQEGFQAVLQRDMLPKFDTLVEPLLHAGVHVVNCTPDSALKLWPFVPLTKVLKEESLARV